MGVLAGPIVTDVLRSNAPSGGIAASLFPEVIVAVREAIGCDTLRIYNTDDVVGVQIASAYVGLLSVALGFVHGLHLGPGTVALLAARGMAEAQRVGVHRGGQRATFSGLGGYGDLIAAVAGDNRPELTVGHQLAQGVGQAAALAAVGHYVETVDVAPLVVAYGHKHQLDARLARTVAAILSGERDLERLMATLLRRMPGRE